MKNLFLKKFITLLNKEVCPKEFDQEKHSPFPMSSYKPLPIRNMKNPDVAKPVNVASSSLKVQETVLSEGVSVKGELHFEKLLRINGCFEGNLVAKGKLILGVKGKVQGDIDLEEAEIQGTVIGNIIVSHLIIGPNAQIIGNIKAQTLVFHKGAKFSGRLEIDPDMSSEKILFAEKDDDESLYRFSM